jgi:hypothetical protein
VTVATAWQLLKEQVDAETERIWREEPEEHRKLRLGVIDNAAGSYGQYFTTWDFANGMIRDYSMYTLYPLLRIGLDPAFTLEHMKKLFRAFDPQYTVYLGYSGFETLETFGRAFLDAMDTMSTKDEFIETLTALLRYANKLAAWSFHYFPWAIGVLFPHSRAHEIVSLVDRRGGSGA